MRYLLWLVAEAIDVLNLGYRPRRRRSGGAPFGFYPGTHPLIWPNV